MNLDYTLRCKRVSTVGAPAGNTGMTEEGYVDVPRPTGFSGFEGEGQGQQGSAGAHPRREGIGNVRPFAGTEERYS